MKALVIGVGLVGRQVATRLRADGHHVVGTTTTPTKVDELLEICDEVHVLRGADTEALAAAAEGCDAVVVLAGPSASHGMSVEDRAATYREVLVDTAEAVVAAAPDAAHIVAVSSLTVYGNVADHLDEITEDAPVTDSTDPSPASFLAAERTYLGRGRAAVLRAADVYGADDPPIEVKVKMAHDYLRGSVPFRADARFYRVHVDDVASAILTVIDQQASGVFNLTHRGVPSTNGELFDRVSADLGLPALEYRDEIAGTSQPISTAALTGLGFTTAATSVWRVEDDAVTVTPDR